MILAVVLSLVMQITPPSVSSFSEDRAARLIEANPEKIERAYRAGKWPSKSILYFEVDQCTQPRLDRTGETATCLVCSIDDAGGSTLTRDDLIWRSDTLPADAVALSASSATFRFDTDRWTLAAYEPIGTNYLAGNRHPFRRSNLNNLKTILPDECAQMNNLMSVIVKGKRKN